MMSIINSFILNKTEPAAQIQKLKSAKAEIQNPLTHKTSILLVQDTLRKFGTDLRKMDQALLVSLVDLEFCIKKGKQDYVISKVAQQVFDSANQITKESENYQQEILNHAEEYVYLYQSYISKRIEVMIKRWDMDIAKVYFDDQKQLVFGMNGQSVLEKRNSADQDCNYDQSGFHTPLNDSGHLYPSFTRKKHDGKFYAAIVTDAPAEFPGKAGYHAWIRLTDQNGFVYSVGKFPYPFKFIQTAKKHPVEFCSADKQEWTSKDGHVKETRFEINETTFKLLKLDIETDLQTALRFVDESKIDSSRLENQDWSFVDQNCADWAISKLLKQKIISKEQHDEVRRISKITTFEAFLPKVYHQFMARLTRTSMTYSVIRGAVGLISRVNYLWKLFMICLGANKKNSQNSRSKPIIGGIKDFLWKQYEITHPYKLRQALKARFPQQSD